MAALVVIVLKAEKVWQPMSLRRSMAIKGRNYIVGGKVCSHLS